MRNDDGVAAFRVAVHGQGLDVAEETRRLVEERLRTDLGAYRERIVAAQVRLRTPSHGNAPVTCNVRVDLRPGGGLALGETGSDVTMALGRASVRMKTALGARLACAGANLSHAWLR